MLKLSDSGTGSQFSLGRDEMLFLWRPQEQMLSCMAVAHFMYMIFGFMYFLTIQLGKEENQHIS